MPRQVLFVRNDPTAPQALLGDVFAECGFEVNTFDVVTADRAGDPSVEVTFPDPGGYDGSAGDLGSGSAALIDVKSTFSASPKAVSTTSSRQA